MTFETSDLYMAAALIASGARRPDVFFLEEREKGGIVKVSWNYSEGDKIDSLVHELQSNEMGVEPHKFRTIHIALKKQALEIVDRKAKDESAKR